MAIYLKSKSHKMQNQSILPGHFYPAHFLCRSVMSLSFQNIFFDTGSMTAIMDKLSNGQMAVSVLNHSWQKSDESERQVLSLNNNWGIAREVILHGKIHPWIYARSFFPESVVKAHGQEFSTLGQRPLGEVLFSKPKVFRSRFNIACLYPWHREYRNAAEAFEEMPEFLWARRSQFYLPSGEIVLLEIFSTEMTRFVEKSEKIR